LKVFYSLVWRFFTIITRLCLFGNGSLGYVASTIPWIPWIRSLDGAGHAEVPLPGIYISADEKFIKGGFFTEDKALMHPNANVAIAKRDADVQEDVQQAAAVQEGVSRG